MKQWRTGLLVFILSFQSFQAFAQKRGAFDEGVKRIPLTAAERDGLLQYAENSKTKLEAVLEEAAGRGADEKFDLYVETIKRVVMESYKHRGAEELLTRIPLNQALLLTAGIPSPDGTKIERPGLLRGTMADGLLARILEESIQLAIAYYKDDRVALNAANFDSLPHSRFAYERLQLARRWIAAIPEKDLKYIASLVVLDQWFTVAFVEDKLHRALYAEELNGALTILEMEKNTDADEFEAHLRILRGVLNKLAADLRTKLVAAGEIEGTAAKVAESADENKIFKPETYSDKEAAKKAYAESFDDSFWEAPFNQEDKTAARAAYLKLNVGTFGVFELEPGFSGSVDAQIAGGPQPPGTYEYKERASDNTFGIGLKGRADYNSRTHEWDRVELDFSGFIAQRNVSYKYFYSEKDTELNAYRPKDPRRKTVWAYKYPSMLVSHREYKNMNYKETGAGISLFEFYIETAKPAGMCFAIEPLQILYTGANDRPLEERNTLNRDGSKFYARFLKTTLCAKQNFGNSSTQLRAEFSASGARGSADANLFQFQAYIGLDRIAGTPVGVGWTFNFDAIYSSDATVEYKDDLRSVFGVNGKF